MSHSVSPFTFAKREELEKHVCCRALQFHNSSPVEASFFGAAQTHFHHAENTGSVRRFKGELVTNGQLQFHAWGWEDVVTQL
jgi:hypothetical protein